MSYRRTVEIIILGALFFFVPILSSSYADVEEVRKIEVSGAEELSGKSRSVAQKNATQNALEKAVKKVVETYISDEVSLDDAEVQKQLKSTIFDKTDSYVRVYQPIRSSARGNMVYVTIAAEIWTQPIYKQLQALGMAQDLDESVGQAMEIVILQPSHYRKFLNLKRFIDESIPQEKTSQIARLTASQITLELSVKSEVPKERVSQTLQSYLAKSPGASLREIEEGRIEVKGL